MAALDGLELGNINAPWRPAAGRLPPKGVMMLDAAAATERAQALDQLDGAFAALNSRGTLRVARYLCKSLHCCFFGPLATLVLMDRVIMTCSFHVAQDLCSKATCALFTYM